MTAMPSSGAKVHSSSGEREARRNAVLTLTQDLLRVPTPDFEGCRVAMLQIAAFLDAEGFCIEEIKVSDAARDNVPMILASLGEKTKQPDAMLCVHIDTSPAGEGWTMNPFGGEISGGRLFGRGAAVSKSSVGVFVTASSSAWRRASNAGGETPTVVVAITSDEGSGGDLGARHLLESLGYRPKLAILPGVADAITVAHKGCIQFTVRVTGMSCHQSVVDKRKDAMRIATKVCSAIYALDDRLRSAGGNYGAGSAGVNAISAGTAFGMAASSVTIAIDRRVAPDQDLAAAVAELRQLIESCAEGSDVQLQIDAVRFAEPFKPSALQLPFVTCLLKQSKQQNGEDLPVVGSPLYTDARWFGANGIPTIMYGPAEQDIGRSGANGADESVQLEMLNRSVLVLEAALTEWFTTETAGS